MPLSSPDPCRLVIAGLLMYILANDLLNDLGEVSLQDGIQLELPSGLRAQIM